jgi:NitT/TauT family transport system substrate-binding protein
MSAWGYVISVTWVAALLGGCGGGTCGEMCSKLKKDAKGYTIVRLQQQWFPNSGFAGEVVAAATSVANHKVAIQVLPGSDQIDTKQVIKLNGAEIGVAGAEQIMVANEKGAGFVVIGVINPRSLACFISKKDKGITSARGMEGRRIGTMEGSPVDLIYQVLKRREGLRIEKQSEVPTGWVLTGFLQDQYDVYPAFINDEPITLRLQGIDVNIVKPSRYGIDFIGTVYFAKRELVKCCPEVVQAFISAVADGWLSAMRDPAGAIRLLKGYDANIDERKELASLTEGTEYYAGDGKVLYASEGAWVKMADLLKEIRYLKSFDYNATVDVKFVNWYHSRPR